MIKKTCTQCGKDFVLNDGEIAFYKKKKLHLPNRCKECRDANKLKNGKEKKIEVIKSDEPTVLPRKVEIRPKENDYSVSDTKEKLTQSRPSDVKARKRKFTLFAIGFIILWLLGCLGLNYLSSLRNEKKQEEQKDTASFFFKSEELFHEHYNKHAAEFPYASQKDYLAGANAVIRDKESLHKTEADDGDEIYYSEAKNEIVFVSAEQFIKTYFKPDGGKSYFEKQ